MKYNTVRKIFELIVLLLFFTSLLISCNNDCYFKNEESIISFQKMDTLVKEYVYESLLNNDTINAFDLKDFLIRNYSESAKHINEVYADNTLLMSGYPNVGISYGKGKPTYFYSDTGKNLDVQNCIIHEKFNQRFEFNNGIADIVIFINTNKNSVYEYEVPSKDLDAINDLFKQSNANNEDIFNGQIIFDSDKYRVLEGNPTINYDRFVESLRNYIYPDNMPKDVIVYLNLTLQILIK